MKIIAFTGMPFSGKSVAVTIAKDMKIPVIRMGDMVWDEVKKRGLPINSETVGEIANDMRKTYGKDIWAKKTIEKIVLENIDDVLIIDGVRNSEEIDIFKNKLGADFKLIAIQTPDDIRHERAMLRKRMDDTVDIETIKKRDKREINWGIKNVINQADIVVTNEGSVEVFQDKIIQILKNNK